MNIGQGIRISSRRFRFGRKVKEMAKDPANENRLPDNKNAWYTENLWDSSLERVADRSDATYTLSLWIMNIQVRVTPWSDNGWN